MESLLSGRLLGLLASLVTAAGSLLLVLKPD